MTADAAWEALRAHLSAALEQITPKEWAAALADINDPVKRAAARRAFEAEIEWRRRMAVERGRARSQPGG